MFQVYASRIYKTKSITKEIQLITKVSLYASLGKAMVFNSKYTIMKHKPAGRGIVQRA